MKKQKFKIEKIEMDKNIKEVAEIFNTYYGKVFKMVKKLNLGYHRLGAGNFRYLTKNDIEKIRKELEVKNKKI